MERLDVSTIREQLEAIRGDVDTVTDLERDIAQVFDERVINQGVHIHIGNKPQVLQRVLDIFGIDQALAQNQLQVHNVLLTTAGSIKHRAKAIPIVKEAGLITALDLMQAEMWERPYGKDAASTILIGSPSEQHGETDISKPWITLDANCHYSKALLQECLGRYNEIKDWARQAENASELLALSPARLCYQYMNATGEVLGGPAKHYHFSIGRVSGTFFASGVSTRYSFGVKADRLIARE
ncbi:MAG: hypothetical protein JWN33_567 [Candidatus Saccharibacteria bacterium]|nr:hypothetical protein [Candidatus Saccharibacteria bacterium]